jgi:hypothetical protein
MPDKPVENDAFERVGLWPIALSLDDGRWFSLWGSGGAERDEVLANDGRLVLSPSLGTLYSWITENPSNIRTFPNFSFLLNDLQNDVWPVDHFAVEYPLAEIASWLREDLPDWSPRQVDDALNSLNLCWDIGHSINDRETCGALTPDSDPLGKFLDNLYEATGLPLRRAATTTPLRMRGRRVALADWDGNTVATAFGELTARVFASAKRLSS